MPSPIFMSRAPVGFSAIAVLRGAQLSLLGSLRAFRNNRFYTLKQIRLLFKAIVLSLVIQLIIMLPVWWLSCVVWLIEQVFVSQPESMEQLVQSFYFILSSVFDIGFILISSIRFMGTHLDDLFLAALQYSNPKYYESLQKSYYSIKDSEDFPERFFRNQRQLSDINEYNASLILDHVKENRQFKLFLTRNLKRSALTLSCFGLSFIPIIGPLVIPTILLFSTHKVMGAPVAFTLFMSGMIFLDRNQSILILSSFWASRSLVNDLLSPFFTRVPFSRTDKTHWLRTREGIMFGFGMAFYWLVKNLPMVSWVLIYGIAQASTAFLVTKVSQPPPTVYGPQLSRWIENEVVWTKQDTFLYGNILE
jgi:hypothetical protein